jgi:HEAT repeat protein
LRALEGFLEVAEDEQARVSIFHAFEPVLAATSPSPEPVAVIQGLCDPSPAVRRAACEGLAGLSTPAALNALADCLSDPAPLVRAAAAQSLRQSGSKAGPYVLARLNAASYPEAVLDAFPAMTSPLSAPLRDYAQGAMGRLRAWQAASHGLPSQGRAVAFLRQVVEARTAQAEQEILKIIGLLGDQRVMQLVARTLQTGDPEARATAVEALDTLGDKQLVKALLPLLEAASASDPPSSAQDGRLQGLVGRLIAETDPLVRAAAIRAAGELELTGLVPQIQPWAAHPSALVSEAARETLHGLGGGVDTLTTLSLVERTLLLKEVPLFSGLLPEDLVQVARAAQERLFADGAVLCHEGEPGDELFVIAAGQVRVSHQAGEPEHVLATRHVGEFVGEMAIIEAMPRFATVSAVGDTRTLVISADTFKAILRDRPEVALAVMRSLSRRLREVH